MLYCRERLYFAVHLKDWKIRKGRMSIGQEGTWLRIGRWWAAWLQCKCHPFMAHAGHLVMAWQARLCLFGDVAKGRYQQFAQRSTDCDARSEHRYGAFSWHAPQDAALVQWQAFAVQWPWGFCHPDLVICWRAQISASAPWAEAATRIWTLTQPNSVSYWAEVASAIAGSAGEQVLRGSTYVIAAYCSPHTISMMPSAHHWRPKNFNACLWSGIPNLPGTERKLGDHI